MPVSHLKVAGAILNCRTAYLGGHVQRCDQCGSETIAYNSCRNRHCPKCQCLTKERWLEARQAELLPTRYFHAVFTLPHVLNPVVLSNKRSTFFSKRSQIPCWPLVVTRTHLADNWALLRCCTPGTNDCAIIFTCTAWFRQGRCVTANADGVIAAGIFFFL